MVDSGTPLWVRHVVVPGLTDSIAHIEALGQDLHGISNIQKVELLPYHTLGNHKYAQMGSRCPLQGTSPMDKSQTQKLQQMLSETIFTEKGTKHDDQFCMAGL